MNTPTSLCAGKATWLVKQHGNDRQQSAYVSVEHRSMSTLPIADQRLHLWWSVSCCEACGMAPAVSETQIVAIAVHYRRALPYV